MRFTDSHCHLNRLKLKEDVTLDAAIEAAKLAQVTRLMTIMCEFDEYKDLKAICARHEHVGMSVGVHPCEDAEQMSRASVAELVCMGSDPDVWAVGETGLDLYYSDELKTEQLECFNRHIEAANQLNKPVVIHAREAKELTLSVLKNNTPKKGILHCFTEDWDMAEQLLDLGLYVSFSGIVSFKNAAQIQEVCQRMPLERLLIETDSPYLAPVPHRGKPNQPQWVPHVAQAVADLRGCSIEEVAEASWDNFSTLIEC